LTRRTLGRIGAFLLLTASALLIAVGLNALTASAAVALVAGALFLMWTNVREQRRLRLSRHQETLRRLIERGMRLYLKVKAPQEVPKPMIGGIDLPLVSLEMEAWVDSTRESLKPLPHFKGIFEAVRHEDAVLQLRERIRRLTEIERLMRFSQKTGLGV
jgi:hypothetical protein